jgi:hypothetical protein
MRNVVVLTAFLILSLPCIIVYGGRSKADIEVSIKCFRAQSSDEYEYQVRLANGTKRLATFPPGEAPSECMDEVDLEFEDQAGAGNSIVVRNWQRPGKKGFEPL